MVSFAVCFSASIYVRKGLKIDSLSGCGWLCSDAIVCLFRWHFLLRISRKTGLLASLLLEVIENRLN